MISYIQHASRAGRAQGHARSIVLLSPEDLESLKSSDLDKEALYRFLSTLEYQRTILGAYFDSVLYPNCIRDCDELCNMCRKRFSCGEEGTVQAVTLETLPPLSLE